MKLNLKAMVIPINCASYLKGLGVRQESLFYWVIEKDGKYLVPHPHANDLMRGKSVDPVEIGENVFSAFLTDELASVLNECPHITSKELSVIVKYKGELRPPWWLNNDWCIGTAIVEFIDSTEEFDKIIRDQRAKCAPHKTKKPDSDGDFK